MKLFLDGITRNVESPKVAAELKRAGYKEVKEEPGETPAPENGEAKRGRKAKDEGAPSTEPPEKKDGE